jgi:subtilisin-like proprotein convertase family protein
MFSVSGLPANAVSTFSPSSIAADGIVSLLVNNTATAPDGFYELTVTAVSGNITKIATVYLNLLSPDFAITVQSAPVNMATGVALNTTLMWEADVNATAYEVALYLDEALTIPFLTATTSTNSVAIAGLSEATNYYWTVKPENAGCEGEVSPAFQFTTGQINCENYNAIDVPVAIPSDSETTVAGTMIVTDAFEMQGITVTLDISHTWVTDMAVTLISPAGTEVVLFSHKCGAEDDVMATFSDAGMTLTCAGTPVISGTVKPEGLLSTLVGEQSNGEWTLEVYDEFPEDGGFINSWSLNLCSVQPALNLIEDSIIEFALYPNPNSGSFTVQMKGISETGQIRISDMHGRTIFAKNVFASGDTLFETINLSAEAGIYMFEIVSDGRKNIKKFIIR